MIVKIFTCMPLSVEKVRDKLRGVSAGLLTPFDDQSNIEYKKVQYNAQTLYERGIRSFLAVANISEFHSLTHSERVEIAGTVVESLPADVSVLAGVGGSTGDARKLIRAYDDVDVDAMMIMPPDHTYRHEKGLLEYYRSLGAVTDRPLIPYVLDFDPSVDYLVELSNLDDVVGIKYALEDTVKLGAAAGAGADDVVWVNGLAEPHAVTTWIEGAEGFSAGVSNFRPEVGLALFDALSAKNYERARRIRDICLPYQNFRDETGENNTIPGAVSIPAVKKGLELAGLHGGNSREPIYPLSPEEERRAEELYEQLDRDIKHVLGS